MLYDGLPSDVRDREHGIEDVTGRENTPCVRAEVTGGGGWRRDLMASPPME